MTNVITSEKNKARKLSRRNTVIAIIAALLVVGIGYALVLTKAAGFFASVSPSSATLSGNAKVVTESDGTKALQFTAPTTTPPPTTPPPTTPPPTDGRPNESNTGYPAGTVLKDWTGPKYDNSSNLVIDGYRLNGSYTFTGQNVTIKNCDVSGGLTFAVATNVTVERCKIRGGISIASSKSVTVQYSNIYEFGSDGFHVTSDRTSGSTIIRNTNITLANNLIHKPTPGCGAHADGIQVRGVDTLVLRNNNFDMGPWKQVCSQDALNAAVFLQDANGGNKDVTMDNNMLAGGGFTFYLGTGPRTKLINNIIKRGNYGWVNNTSKAGDVIQATNNVNENGVCLKASDDRNIGLNGCQ